MYDSRVREPRLRREWQMCRTRCVQVWVYRKLPKTHTYADVHSAGRARSAQSAHRTKDVRMDTARDRLSVFVSRDGVVSETWQVPNAY